MALAFSAVTGCNGSVQRQDSVSANAPPAVPLPGCEWCGVDEAPPALSSTMRIGVGETGERLVITGTIYENDGRTPASGVLLYAYQTDAGGVYPKRGDETGNARRHGFLRGWLRTGADGRYLIETIRPGSYPTRSEPAHVHMTLRPPGEPERYIDDVVFEGDPLLTAEHRARLRQRGGTGITQLQRSDDGFHVTRDIYLARQ